MSDSSGENGTKTVSLADEEAVKQVLIKSVFGLWDVIHDLTRLRPSTHERLRVTIFGSARAMPGTFVYEEVKRIAAALAEMGCDVITGGGPGLMQAANEGAVAAGAPQRSSSVGIRVDLPFEQELNPFVGEGFEHKTFFSRLHHFVLASDAFVVVPGGIGSVLELTMVWQLLQVRHVSETPLILVGAMWTELLEWARRYLLGAQIPLVNPEDLDIPRCVASADEAIAVLREFHERWTTEK